MSKDIGKARVKVEFDQDSVNEGVEKTKGGILGKLGAIGIAGGAALAAGIGAAAIGAGKALYDIGATFDDVTDTIRVGTGASGKALDSLVGSAKNIGRDIPAAFEDIGSTVADVNTRLGLTGPTLETLSKQILEAGRMLGEEIDINNLSGAFSAFKVEGEATTGAMDDLFRVSQATGVGMNDLSQRMAKSGAVLGQLGFDFTDTAALIGVLNKAGVDSNAVVASMQRSLVNLAKDGEKPADAFKRVTGELQGYVDKGDDAAALELAGKVFGTRGAGQFVAALKSGKVNLDNIAESAGLSGDTILGLGKETADFSEQWQLFKNRALLAIEPVASRVFGIIGDGMAWINDVGVPALQKVREAFGFLFSDGDSQGFAEILDNVFGNTGELIPLFTTIGDTIRDVVGQVKTWFTGTFVPALTAVGDAAKKLGTAVMPILKQIGAYIVDHWPQISAVVRQVFSTVGTIVSTYLTVVKQIIRGVTAAITFIWNKWGSDILGFVSKAFSAIGQIIRGALKVIQGVFQLFKSVFTGDWKGAWEAVKKILSGVWDVIKGVVRLALNVVKGLLSAAWAVIKTGASAAWNGIKALISATWENIKSQVRAAVDWVKGRISSAWNGIKSAASSAWNGIKSTISGAWDGIKRAVSERVTAVVDFAKGLPGRVARGIGNMGSTLYQKGRDLIQGLLDGAGSLLRKIGQFFLDKVPGFIREPFKKALGIASPSKVFAGYGANIAEGLVLGMEKSHRDVAKATSSLVAIPSARIPSMRTELVADAYVTGDGSGGATVNVYPAPGMSEEQIGASAARRLEMASIG